MNTLSNTGGVQSFARLYTSKVFWYNVSKYCVVVYQNNYYSPTIHKDRTLLYMIMKIPKYSLWKESKHLNTSFHTPNKWKIILITSLKIWVLNYINVSDYNDNQIVFWFTQFLYIGSHSYWWNFKQCICKYHGQRHSLVELNNLILSK